MTMADAHDLLAAERFLAAEARIAETFGRVEEAIRRCRACRRRWSRSAPPAGQRRRRAP
jgi:hypothetical protein